MYNNELNSKNVSTVTIHGDPEYIEAVSGYGQSSDIVFTKITMGQLVYVYAEFRVLKEAINQPGILTGFPNPLAIRVPLMLSSPAHRARCACVIDNYGGSWFDFMDFDGVYPRYVCLGGLYILK